MSREEDLDIGSFRYDKNLSFRYSVSFKFRSNALKNNEKIVCRDKAIFSRYRESSVKRSLPFVYITNIFLYLYPHQAYFILCAEPEYTFISARIVRGSGGPILRIAGVSPAMLSACKSPGRYHLTLIGSNPETGSTPVHFQTRYFSRFLHRYSSRNYAVVYGVTGKTTFEVFQFDEAWAYAWKGICREFSLLKKMKTSRNNLHKLWIFVG